MLRMSIRKLVFIWEKPRKAMKGYSRSKEDYREQLIKKYLFYNQSAMSEIREDPWCLTLSEDMMDERDFKAEEVIELDTTIQLPKSFSLGQWIRKTNYQNWWGSCTSNATSHGVQVLAVKDNGKKPETENIITPNWKDLWTKMGHDLNNKNDSWDYVEKAVNTALKEWISNVEWWESKFDGYCYGSRDRTDKSIETMKRYLYNWNPIVWCLRWNKTTWSELTKWQLRTLIDVTQRTGWHAVCLVWWDEWWLRFVNSWATNDGKGYKSRFYVTYADMKKLGTTFNWRYWALFKKEQVKKDTEYLKRKSTAVVILKALKKQYDNEPQEVKEAIVKLSQAYRKAYPEINEELPIN